MFEQTLSPETAARRGWHKSRFFPAALAVHGAGLLAVLGASLWTVEEPPEPPVPITWVSPVAPVQAPPARGSGAPPAAAARGPRRAMAAPAAIPDRLPGVGSLPEPVGEIGPPGEGPLGPLSDHAGESSGDEGNGVDGGLGRGGDPRSGSDRGILVPGGDVHAPVLVLRVEPVYPEGARKARLEGDVILEAIITAQGEIEEVHVVKSAGALLDARAEGAVRRWRYRPATLNGRTVRVLLTVTISFRLH